VITSTISVLVVYPAIFHLWRLRKINRSAGDPPA
jgi:uncharacterized membrane protein YqjE